MKKIILCLFSSICFGQQFTVLNQERADVNFRGISFESDEIFLISGSNNTIGKTTNGGRNFNWISPIVVNGRDFRDVEVINKNTYVALSIGSPAYILLTKDGGFNWEKVYENSDPKIFLDALHVDYTTNKIYALGDPIEDHKPFVLEASIDNLSKWESVTKILNQNTRLRVPKESFFASSGSNMYADEEQVLIATGGVASNLYRYTQNGGQLYTLPKTESTTAGINGLAYDPEHNIGYMVGGDFMKPTESDNNVLKFKINDNKVEILDMWSYPKGYKSGVTILSKEIAVVCGYSGVEYTTDAGFNWREVTKDSYNACYASPDKKSVIIVGGKGKVAKLSF